MRPFDGDSALPVARPARAAGLPEVRGDHLARALSAWSAAEFRQFDRLLARFLADMTTTAID
jgi:hypothetical protein